jgi:hypothetical protein
MHMWINEKKKEIKLENKIRKRKYAMISFSFS